MSRGHSSDGLPLRSGESVGPILLYSARGPSCAICCKRSTAPLGASPRIVTELPAAGERGLLIVDYDVLPAEGRRQLFERLAAPVQGAHALVLASTLDRDDTPSLLSQAGFSNLLARQSSTCTRTSS